MNHFSFFFFQLTIYGLNLRSCVGWIELYQVSKHSNESRNQPEVQGECTDFITTNYFLIFKNRTFIFSQAMIMNLLYHSIHRSPFIMKHCRILTRLTVMT